MKVKYWFITGDTHGSGLIGRLSNLISIPESGVVPETIGLIILGDVGLNYYLDSRDRKLKTMANRLGYQLYCLRGNHEERPENVEGMILEYDENVHGEVYYEPDFPNIKYFKTFGEYQIFRYKILVVGGAYSVDKEYRQLMGYQWFPGEQLTESETVELFELATGNEYDLVLSHTCPYDWRPTDLFLSCIDQSKVDTTMEKMLNLLKDYIYKWDKWCFGHYHDDRFVRPDVMMFYHEIAPLETIMGDIYVHDFANRFGIDPKFDEVSK